MANPFLEGKSHEEIETAIIYEKAKIHNIGKAVAFTDGSRLFVNTDDNLAMILPNYNKGMLKWILWHEKMHMELKHHSRFFKYLKELDKKSTLDKFQLTKDEVNIIMDILVHDSLSKMFPELVETAVNNCAQFRDRNSLGYTFKTFTLEEMLDEYKAYKDPEKKSESKDGESSEEEKEETEEGEKKEEKKGHKESHSDKKEEDKKKLEDGEPKIDTEAERPEEELTSKHDQTDWSHLEQIDTSEFIDKEEADRYEEEINKLKRKKIRIGRLTQKLNGLATSKKERTYRLPSILQTGDGCIFKGKLPGRVELYLVFDASGSMNRQMKTFKDIITKSIPQALNCPCEWFAGYGARIKPYKEDRHDGYFKGTYKDFISVEAYNGYDDDGDRTIELCYYAEQQGFTPIGITDGGGRLSWSKDKLKQLKRTILVGQNSHWLSEVRKINPNVQTLEIYDEDDEEY